MDRSNSIAIGVLALALIGTQISHLIDLRKTHAQLEAAMQSQNTAIANNRKAELQLDALAKGVNELAKSGNANAKRIVETLKQNGVSIKS